MTKTARTERVGKEAGQANPANAAVIGESKREHAHYGSSGNIVRRRKPTPGCRSKRLGQRFGRIYEVANKVDREDLTSLNLRLKL